MNKSIFKAKSYAFPTEVVKVPPWDLKKRKKYATSNQLISQGAFILITLLLAFFSARSVSAQNASNATRPVELARADSITNSIGRKAVAIEQLDSLLAVYESFADTCGMMRILSKRCYILDLMGQLDLALIDGQKALGFFRSGCDSIFLMDILIHITNVELSLGNNENALKFSTLGLDNWNNEWDFSPWHGLKTNQSIALVYLGKTEEALNGFQELKELSLQHGSSNLIIDSYENLGAMFGMLYQEQENEALLDSVEKYQLLALDLSRNSKLNNIINLYSNIASLAIDRGKYSLALAYLDSCEALAAEQQSLPQQVTIAYSRSLVYFKLNDFKNAYNYSREQIVLNDSLLNIEKMKAITEMQEKYESEKKAGQIKELTIENLAIALKQEQATRIRNIFFFIGIGVLLIAIALYSRLLFTRKAKAQIEREKEVSESLLLNILPFETAQELKAKGSADAKLINQVTVLFTDFKGFTAMSEILSPKELVADLHKCFSDFDRICEKYGIEKIKTIGDAYMAAGGLPTPNKTHPQDVVKAALEMAEVVEKGKFKKIAEGLPFFEVRIGVHTGPVVAGIVGIKKFSYDIWGDTVNTASRMESSGEVGKVNISESTYQLLKETPDFEFESRGKIEAKGKGEIEMYFVNNEMNTT
ncbi:MAG: adenylate/guanylate cyclase domain-containing protein [Cryomorphaceae bacterium]|nr:adenylate/guanylate cyclase domain-containing protein [Cryomorphaceae bacterium]